MDTGRLLFRMLLVPGWIIRVLPYPVRLLPAAVLALVFIVFSPSRLSVALQNARLVFEERSSGWRLGVFLLSLLHHALSFLELLSMPVLSKKQLEQRFVIQPDDLALLRAGGLLVLPHAGCWEQPVAGLCPLEIPLACVYRPLHARAADAVVKVLRESRGTLMLPAKGAVSRAAELLDCGHLVCMVPDQHFKRDESVACEFFGRMVSVAPGPALLQLKTGCRAVVGAFFRDWKTGRYLFTRHSIVPAPRAGDAPRDVTRGYFRCFEDLIRRHPEQYWWIHKQFKRSHAYSRPA